MSLKIISLKWLPHLTGSNELTHWDRVTHVCVSKLTIIGSDNDLSPDRRQAIIWTNAGILLIGPLGTNFSEILIKILTLSFKKMRLQVLSAKRWPFCVGLNVLMHHSHAIGGGKQKTSQKTNILSCPIPHKTMPWFMPHEFMEIQFN